MCQPQFYARVLCEPCHPACEVCFGPLEYYCASCRPGYSFASPSSCRACTPPCQTCGVLPDSCLTCVSGFYLEQAFCFICPQDCFLCGSMGRCLACKRNLMLSE